jgi:hypothetical protein
MNQPRTPSEIRDLLMEDIYQFAHSFDECVNAIQAIAEITAILAHVLGGPELVGIAINIVRDTGKNIQVDPSLIDKFKAVH